MSIWVALILKQGTTAILGEHADICFTEAETQQEAIHNVANNKWLEPWGKKGASSCVIVKIFKISETPSSMLVGLHSQQAKLSQDLRKLCANSAQSRQVKSNQGSIRVRRKKK